MFFPITGETKSLSLESWSVIWMFLFLEVLWKLEALFRESISLGLSTSLCLVDTVFELWFIYPFKLAMIWFRLFIPPLGSSFPSPSGISSDGDRDPSKLSIFFWYLSICYAKFYDSWSNLENLMVYFGKTIGLYFLFYFKLVTVFSWWWWSLLQHLLYCFWEHGLAFYWGRWRNC